MLRPFVEACVENHDLNRTTTSLGTPTTFTMEWRSYTAQHDSIHARRHSCFPTLGVEISDSRCSPLTTWSTRRKQRTVCGRVGLHHGSHCGTVRGRECRARCLLRICICPSRDLSCKLRSNIRLHACSRTIVRFRHLTPRQPL